MRATARPLSILLSELALCVHVSVYVYVCVHVCVCV